MKLALFIPILTLTLSAQDWPRFRGPNGSGISSGSGFPTEFSPARNCIWKAPVRGGKSSPVLTARHVFMTGFEKAKLYTQCFDRKTGKPLWEQSEARRAPSFATRKNEPAAISPVTDGENVYAFFADYGLVSYDVVGRHN